MKREQLTIVGGTIGGLVIIVLLAVLLLRSSSPTTAPVATVPAGSGINEAAAPPTVAPQGYVDATPAGVVPTKPTNVIPSPSQNLSAAFKFFTMTVDAGGFSPSLITVRKGADVQIAITAKDSNYDIEFPYLGIYQTIRKGETQLVGFQATAVGSFDFQCRDLCPSSGKIKGLFVVIP